MGPFESVLLFGGGVAIGAYSVVVGGGMYLSVPLLLYLAPGNAASLVGTIKAGSALRGAGMIGVSRHKLSFSRERAAQVGSALTGAVFGSLAFSSTTVSEVWILPVMVASILWSEFMRRRHFVKPLPLVLWFVVGLYAGVWGAGISLILLVAVMVGDPTSGKADATLEARTTEFFLSVVSALIFLAQGAVIESGLHLWVGGSFVGGMLGGWILLAVGEKNKASQEWLLWLNYVSGLIGAALLLVR